MPAPSPGFRDEAGEDRPFRMGCGDGDDIRHDAREPRHLPVSALGKHSLHIDADMNRGFSGRSITKLVVLRHGFILKSQLQRSAADLVPVLKGVAACNPASPAAMSGEGGQGVRRIATAPSVANTPLTPMGSRFCARDRPVWPRRKA